MPPAPSVQAVNRQTGLAIGSTFALGESLASGAGRWARLFLTFAVDFGFNGQVTSLDEVGWELPAPWEQVRRSHMGTTSADSRVHVVETWTAFMRDDPLPSTATLVNTTTGVPLVENATQTNFNRAFVAPSVHDCICVAVTPGYAPSVSRALSRSGSGSSLLAPTIGTSSLASTDAAGLFLQVDRLDPRNLGATYPDTGRNSFTGVSAANGFTIVNSTWSEWRVSVRNFETATSTPPLIHTVSQSSAQQTWGMWVVGNLMACDVPDPYSPTGWVRGHIWG